MFNDTLRQQFDEFYAREDTFSLGICNGCQVMALLGWVPWSDTKPEEQPRFVLDESSIFESRFVSVRILESPAIIKLFARYRKKGVCVNTLKK